MYFNRLLQLGRSFKLRTTEVSRPSSTNLFFLRPLDIKVMNAKGFIQFSLLEGRKETELGHGCTQ